MNPESKKQELKDIDTMGVAELKAEAKVRGIPNYQKMLKSELIDKVATARFMSSRENQHAAIMKAKEIKGIMGNRWFTVKEYSEATCPVVMEKGLRKKGKPILGIADAASEINTLGMFGLMDRKIRVGKSTKYKVKMEAAVKAIAAHNRNMQAAIIIDGKRGKLIKK